MVKGTVLLDRNGPLPLSSTFEVSADTQVLLVAGSVITGTGGGVQVGIGIIVDGNQIGQALVNMNITNAHAAVVPQYFALSLDAGSEHTLELVNANGNTGSDRYDHFRVLLIE